MLFDKIFGIILRTVFPVLCAVAITFSMLQFSGCSSFKVYDKSTMHEENIYYSTLLFYAQKDKEKNDVIINTALEKLYKKIERSEIDNKKDFCKQVSFGKDEISENDLRYLNYTFCMNKKIVVE